MMEVETSILWTYHECLLQEVFREAPLLLSSFKAQQCGAFADKKQEERDKRSSRDRPETVKGQRHSSSSFLDRNSLNFRGTEPSHSVLWSKLFRTFCCYFYIEPAATSIYKVHQQNEVHL
ncbi:hypothetical protein WMY93_034080 [Mugilogobius chulae]|uniref:Uncharacterized protein n=1 Tax=Mugilogobius chulae TaxID=88201 RepID=A0AAW0MPT3_9GOBI